MATKKINNKRREQLLRGLQILGTLGLITLLPSFNKVAEVLPNKKDKEATSETPTTAVWG
jgi:hypothetical protein